MVSIVITKVYFINRQFYYEYLSNKYANNDWKRASLEVGIRQAW